MELTPYDKAEQAKATLKELGYYVDNLWQVEDVRTKYECTDEEAYSVLDSVLNGDRIKAEINETIDIEAEISNLTKKCKSFFISGYWKDDKVKFSDHLVVDREEYDEEDDESIFFYGISEGDIQTAIMMKWNCEYEFVITSYTKL